MKHTIYIIDDNSAVREALVMMIEEEPDLEVCGVAETATDALDVIPEVRPDLVLSDFSLPGMTGIELIERLRIVGSQQRVAVLSAHAESIYAERALTAGANGYIVKGDPHAMMAGIRQVLSGEVYVSRSLRTLVHGEALDGADPERH